MRSSDVKNRLGFGFVVVRRLSCNPRSALLSNAVTAQQHLNTCGYLEQFQVVFSNKSRLNSMDSDPRITSFCLYRTNNCATPILEGVSAAKATRN